MVHGEKCLCIALIKIKDMFHFQILFRYLSLSLGFFFYEMLMEIRICALNLVALLVGPTLAIGIAIGGAEGTDGSQ
jgi:hypothetical protein